MNLKRTAYLLIIVALVIAFLWIAKQLLIPLVVAILIWYIINALAHWLGKVEPIRKYLPYWSQLLLSGLVILLVLASLTNLIIQNAQAMANEGSVYQEHLTTLIERVGMQLPAGFTVKPITEALNSDSFGEFAKFIDFSNFSLGAVASRTLDAVGGVVGNGLLIVIYLIFIFFEQIHFRQKIASLFPDQVGRERFLKIVDHINDAVRAYFKVKITVSVITAVLSYALMRFIGLDFAVLWAFLIFLLNFIPNIGSLIATLFPSLMAIVQFESTLAPFFAVLIGVGAIQIIVGNLIEPRMMGSSLNISSLVVILSLSIWGTLWGITGMILCVPITVIMMIIFAEFEATRPVAILLSENGELISKLEQIQETADEEE